MRNQIALACTLLAACIDAPQLDDKRQDSTVCGVGQTVTGIDVSYYQGTIDWSAVAGSGMKYAFVRVSDGTGFPDPQFDSYWAGSRAAGIYHGAYQFFEPAQDPIAQADLVLAKIGGTLAPDDLPPVLDVEVSGGLGGAAVAANVKTWVDHVAAAIGRPPIIYTGKYFWEDNVADADESASPLWHAQYTSASCPDIADAWSGWAFWQYTSTGTVAGIGSDMDIDRWNGDEASLQAFLGPAAPCGTIDATGGVIDNGDPCYTTGGPAAYIRHVTDAGMGDNLDWTHTTNTASEDNYAQWNLYFAQAGSYELSVYTAAAYAQSKQARYVVTSSGGATRTVTIDQTAVDGWQSLGTFQFDAGGAQSVNLGDNTGEPNADNVQLVFDALQIAPAGSGSDGSDADPGAGSGSDPGDGGPGKLDAGCSAGTGGGGWMIVVAIVGLVRRRRSPRARILRVRREA
ncbi:MAG TPA: GH25 family lysozyme [Kofleriaceae bacterium]|nr:GH25 family lysozyme [Kofleriaceae bacterium]